MTDVGAAYRAEPACLPIPDLDTARLVVAVTAQVFAISPDHLRHSRKRNHVEARQVAMAVIRANTSMSWPALGRFFERDHSSCINAVERVLARPEMCAWAHAVEKATRAQEAPEHPFANGYNGGAGSDDANRPPSVAIPSLEGDSAMERSPRVPCPARAT